VSGLVTERDWNNNDVSEFVFGVPKSRFVGSVIIFVLFNAGVEAF
jgi:hypothetical protein